MDDEQLLERWRRGDSLAGHELFKRYHQPMVMFFQRRTSRDLEDLVQETFLRLVNSLGRPIGSFRAYLFGIARHVIYDHYWRSGREVDEELDCAETIDGDQKTWEELEMDMERQKLLVAALRTLSLETQIIIELRYWQEMSMKEIACVLGLKDGTVRVRCFRARRELGQRMDALAASMGASMTSGDLLDAWEREVEAAIDACSPSEDDAG